MASVHGGKGQRGGLHGEGMRASRWRTGVAVLGSEGRWSGSTMSREEGRSVARPPCMSRTRREHERHGLAWGPIRAPICANLRYQKPSYNVYSTKQATNPDSKLDNVISENNLSVFDGMTVTLHYSEKSQKFPECLKWTM